MNCRINKLGATLTSFALLATLTVSAIPANAVNLNINESVAQIALTTADTNILSGQKSQIVEFEKYINQLRAEYGLNPVKFNANASVEAYKWSEYMSKTGDYRHTLDKEVEKESVKHYSRRNENIAWSTSSSVSSMFNQWKTSDSHRVNMIDPSATSFGVGFYTANGKTYGTTLLHTAKTTGYMPETYDSSSSYYSGGNPVNISNDIVVNVPAPVLNKTNNTYTIPAVDGVRYWNHHKEEFVPAGTYKIYGNSLYIIPVMSSGYKSSDPALISKGGWGWKLNDNNYKDSYVPSKPTVTGTTVILPYDEWVRYYVNGVIQYGYEYDASNLSSVKVTAKIKPEYSDFFQLDEYEDGWEIPIGTKSVFANSVIVDNKALTYTVPTTTGVQYLINGSVRSAGTYKATAGSTINVSVRPLSGYHVERQNTYSFSHKFVSSMKSVTPSAPSFNTTNMTYTVPSVTGVTYKVNGATVNAGTYKASYSTTYKITAHANSGYALNGTSSWSKTYGSTPVISVTPKFPTVNVTEGTYTIPSTTGVNYYVDGVYKTAGNYSSGYKNISVTTKAISSKYALTGTSSWSFKLAKINATPKTPTTDIAKKKLTLPSISGVNYYINGKFTKAGTYNAYSYTTVTAKASAKNYNVKETTWKFDYRTSVKPSAPKAKPSYVTIPKTNGVKYYVNGVLRNAGTYKMSGYVKVTASAYNGNYKLSGTTLWSYRFSTPARPTSNASGNTITIPSTAGVNYYINNKLVKAGTHKNYGGYYTVTSKPVNSTTFLSGTQSWKVDNRNSATPAKVTWSASKNRIYIPSKTGVKYYINGTYVKAGTHSNRGGYYTVTAKASSGSYKLAGTQSWKVDNRNSVTPKAPTFSTGGNSVKIYSSTGVKYYVNGVYKKPGTYKYKNGTTLKVTTKVSSSSYKFKGTQSWTKKI